MLLIIIAIIDFMTIVIIFFVYLALVLNFAFILVVKIILYPSVSKSGCKTQLQIYK